MTESHTISLDEIRTLAGERFGDMIKGVVDLERGILGHVGVQVDPPEIGLLRPVGQQTRLLVGMQVGVEQAQTGWNSTP